MPFFSLSFPSVIQYKVLFIHPPLNNLCSADSFSHFYILFVKGNHVSVVYAWNFCFHNFQRKATLALFCHFYISIFGFASLFVSHFDLYFCVFAFFSLWWNILCVKKKNHMGGTEFDFTFFCFPPHLKLLP